MTEHQTSRTLVKSAPELWAECCDAASLARHLGAFGEIRITKLEPETAVAWEGTAASGTVRLEPSGWGTRVTLTLTAPPGAPGGPESEAEPETMPTAGEPAPVTEPEPVTEPAPVSAPARPRMLARLALRFRREPVADPDAPEPEIEDREIGEPSAEVPTPTPAPNQPETGSELEQTPVAVVTATEPAGENALAAALDSLGRAHHRPYSRA